MTMTIQLDGSALERLFPEGSEARLNLQAAVVNNFIDKIGVKKLESIPGAIVAKLDRAIEDMCSKADTELRVALKDKGILEPASVWYSTNVKLTPQASALVREQAEAIFKGEVARSLGEHIDALDLPKLIADRVQIDSNAVLRSLIATEVDLALKKRFA